MDDVTYSEVVEETEQLPGLSDALDAALLETDTSFEEDPLELDTDLTSDSDPPSAGSDLETDTETGSLFDLEEHSTARVPVTVGDETIEVPLADVVGNYQRGSTLERAERELQESHAEIENARRVYDALRNDPQGTLELLARNAGYQLTVPGGSRDDDDDDDDWDDYAPADSRASSTPNPLQQRVEQLEQQLASAAQDRVMADAVRAATGLIAKDEIDLKPTEVVEHAIKTGLPSIEAAYRDLSYPILLERLKERKTQATGARVTAARKASKVTATPSKQTGAVTETRASKLNLRESLDEALKTLDVPSTFFEAESIT